MKVTNRTWQLNTLIGMRDRIEHQPVYQRGDVWSRDKQQLLIDSILRHYDVPKIYLRKLKNNALYSHQIVDGQQRLTAIWRYTGTDTENFRLHSGNDVPKAWAKKCFNELSKEYRDRILEFPIVVAEIEEGRDSEIRELFARLQKGMQLNSAEIRNSIRSEIGREIRTLALMHPFFSESPFSEKRYKHHDLTAHAFAAQLNGDRLDMKAPDLKQMYLHYADCAPKDINISVHENLNYMWDMLRAVPRCIRTKWGFVDVYMVVCHNTSSRPNPSTAAKRYQQFEEKRLAHIARPEVLLSTKAKVDKEMYNYIQAFKLSAGEAKQLQARYTILRNQLV